MKVNATLPSFVGAWQACGMATPPRSRPAAGGFPIAIGAIIGTGIGLMRDQVTIGFLIGLGAGIVVALAIWLLGRR